MDRTAVFVDAGYLFAAGSRLLANEKLPRAQLNLDYEQTLKTLAERASEATGLPLLRIYWYDGTSTGPTQQHLALSYRPNVKLRLGFLNPNGGQRGVDAMLVTDLINLARNRAMADALVMTGDEDIGAGVQQAQELGVRVHLLGIAPSRENQSGFLVQEADSVRELGLAEVRAFLSYSPGLPTLLEAPPTPESEPVGGVSTLESTAQRLAGELRLEEKEAVLRESAGGSVPSQVDRRLLVAGSRALGWSPLTREQKRHVRTAFVQACRGYGM